MDEKDRNMEERKTPIHDTKLTWETPTLYALDKWKTEGGPFIAETEDTNGSLPS